MPRNHQPETTTNVAETSREPNKLWHWLIKHPVEFSKNKHTPAEPPTPSRQPHQGHPSHPTSAGQLLYLTRSTSRCQELLSVPVAPPEFARASPDRVAVSGSGCPADRPAPSSEARPGSLPASYLTRLVSQSQVRFPGESHHPAQSGSAVTRPILALAVSAVLSVSRLQRESYAAPARNAS